MMKKQGLTPAFFSFEFYTDTVFGIPRNRVDFYCWISLITDYFSCFSDQMVIFEFGVFIHFHAGKSKIATRCSGTNGSFEK